MSIEELKKFTDLAEIFEANANLRVKLAESNPDARAQLNGSAAAWFVAAADLRDTIAELQSAHTPPPATVQTRLAATARRDDL